MPFPLAALILFFLCFTAIATLRFRLALGLFFFLLPTYLIRFDIGPLPTTMLEVMFGILVIVWLIHIFFVIPTGVRSGAKDGVEGSFGADGDSFEKHHSNQIIRGFERSLDFVSLRHWADHHFARDDKKQHLLFFISLSLFLLGATISIFTATDLRAALGEWKAFYVEPILLGAILFYEFRNDQTIQKKKSVIGDRRLVIGEKPTTNHQSPISNLQSLIILSLILSGLATAILAISQHFTGWMVPWDFWENGNTYRVTGWWGFPNGVGIYLAPIIPLAVGLLVQSWEGLKKLQKITENYRKLKQIFPNFLQFILILSNVLFLLTAPLAIFYAKSTGAIIGIAAGIGTLLLIYKKTRWPTIIIGVIGLASLASFSSLASIKQEILFQDRSGQIRLSMWAETWEFLKDHPIRGAGLASYQERILPYHTQVNGENIEIFHHPHNLFLTMWVNIGLLGLVGFVGIIISLIHVSIKNIQYSIFNIQYSIFFASLITILIMGFVDSPYIKNDWAMIFWAVVAMMAQPAGWFNKKNEHVGS